MSGDIIIAEIQRGARAAWQHIDTITVGADPRGTMTWDELPFEGKRDQMALAQKVLEAARRES
jgi:hypothetical protein